MKRSKSSLVYQYLPHNWVSYSDKGDNKGSYSMRINFWNYEELKDVYVDRLTKKIVQKLKAFRHASGDTSEFGNLDNLRKFKFVEVSPREGFAGVAGDISPLVFYCNKCGYTKNTTKHNYKNLKCPHCHLPLKQIQLIYTCNCGYASPVILPNKEGAEYLFKPVPGDQKSNFRFIERYQGRENFKEMRRACPDCGAIIYPRNAFDGRNYKPHSISAVNLINKQEGELLKKGLDADKLQVARWLQILSADEYTDVLNNQKAYFDSVTPEEFINTQVKNLMLAMGLDENTAKSIILSNPVLSESGRYQKLKDWINKVDNHVLIENNPYLSEELVEYFALKYPELKLSKEQAVDTLIESEAIIDEDEITDLHDKLGISDVQISFDIEIINSSYGYTRTYGNPESVTQGVLKMKSFRQKNEVDFLAYSNKLKTEGLLLEFDRRKIIEWLYENNIIDESQIPPVGKEKEWFIKNVDIAIIEKFGDIPLNDAYIITKYVYGLIHTMSHMFIKSAGEMSGLSKDSLSEIVLPNIPAVFIYGNTSQAIPLGSLSGMFEKNYKRFLDKAFELSQDCVFDPLCSEENGACVGCTHLSEVTCSNFNSDLSRFYLIGSRDSEKLLVKKGFWK